MLFPRYPKSFHMHARAHLLRLQKTLYGRFQASARTALGSPSPALRRYFERYQREFQKTQAVISEKEFLKTLALTEILICGDYHTLAQAQRTALDLFQSVCKMGKTTQKQVLALEMLPSRCTPWIDRFQAGEISENAFLEKVSYHRNWGFPWQNYRPLFEFARANGISIVGLNLTSGKNSGTLQKRDEHAARVIARLRETHSDARIFVLFGDLHLAGPHLPRCLEKELKRRDLTARVTVVHQNSETVYWKLARKNVESENPVVRLAANNFCILNVAPWVKLQSYLEWLETNSEDAPAAVEDWNDNIDELRRSLAAFLEVKRLKSAGFSLVSVPDPLAIAPLRKHFRRNRRRWNLISQAIRKTPSLFLLEGPWLCLRRPTHNQAASLAASLLHSELCDGYPKLATPKKDFYRWVWAEALSFLGSKIIHPHRACWGIDDYRFFASQATPPAQWIRAVARYFEVERSWLEVPEKTGRWKRPKVVAGAPVQYLFVARAAGRVLGNSLYQAFVDGHVSQKEIIELFRSSLASPDSVSRRYFQWVRRLDAHGARGFSRRKTK